MKKLFTLFAVAALAFAAQANVLSVCQGEYYSGSVPVYGLWYDTPGFTQQIYPADMLAEMAGGQITEVSFLTLSNLDGSAYGQDFSSYYLKFSEGQITLSLMEVNELGFTEEVAMTGAQVVSTIVPEYGAPALTFVLDEPFQYNGGNLLVEVTVVEPGEYATTYFWGTAMVDENDEDIYTPTLIGNENYSGVLSTSLSSFLCAADFTYEAGTPEPTEKTADPNVSAVPGDHIYTITITNNANDPDAVIYVRINDGEYEVYTEPIVLTEFGEYWIYTYALTDGKLPSNEVALKVTIDENTQPELTAVSELNGQKAVAGVRYFNMAGQEMQQAEGLTIVVTTYTDGTSSAVKVMK